MSRQNLTVIAKLLTLVKRFKFDTQYDYFWTGEGRKNVIAKIYGNVLAKFFFI